MPNGPSRFSRLTASLGLASSLGLGAAALVLWAGPAQADTCPTVDPSTGAVTPAPAPGVQWSGCDLVRANMTDANLAGANLTQSNISNADLTGANLSGAQLKQANLTDTTLSGATLTGVSSGSIIGTPSSLPSGWTVVSNYLVGPGASLVSAGLGDTDLSGLDLSGADLTNATVTGSTLTGTDLAGATLTGLRSGSITGTPASLPANWSVVGGYLFGPGADLDSANLIDFDLSGLTLTGIDFNAADLSGASFSGTNLDDAILTQVNLGGTDLTGASLTGEQSSQITGTPAALPAGWSIIGGFLIGPGADLQGANLEALNLTGADLSGANLSGADAEGASLDGASLSQANLTSANFLVANLTDAQFTGAKLTDTALDGATITGASLAGATLTGTSGVELKGSPASLPAHWSVVGGYLIGPGAGTDFTDADLNNLNLTGVDFSGVSLLRATFQHANLTSANLTKTNLTGADFTSANLTKADLDGAKVSSTVWTATVWSDTICPNGTNSDSYAHGRCYAPPPVSPFKATALPVPAGAPANDVIPLAISCPTSTQCSAGATYPAGGLSGNLGVLLHWTGRQWTEIPSPLPSDKTTDRAEDRVASMSCPSATRCLAGGAYTSRTGDDALLLSWSGKNWTAAKAPLPANANINPDASVTGMACPSVTSCFAVGAYSGDNDEFGLLLHWSGSKWTAATAPAPAGTSQTSLSGVSCPSATLCFATGEYGQGGAHLQPLILRWSGDKWAVVNVPLPAGANASPQVNMGGLSCPTTTHCVAVGSYLDSQGNEQGMLLTRSGTTWTAAKAPLPSGAASEPEVILNAVSCPTGSQCTAAGGYENTAGQPEGLLLLWSGSAWKAEPTPPGAYMVNGISCPTTTRCVAVSQKTSGPVALTGP